MVERETGKTAARWWKGERAVSGYHSPQLCAAKPSIIQRTETRVQFKVFDHFKNHVDPRQPSQPRPPLFNFTAATNYRLSETKLLPPPGDHNGVNNPTAENQLLPPFDDFDGIFDLNMPFTTPNDDVDDNKQEDQDYLDKTRSIYAGRSIDIYKIKTIVGLFTAGL
ncbi:hypothetical protein QYF36_023883 [Acer negundo]|nr:hypothetical protein QYF36_023883 [Acer negundo]